MSEAKLPTSRKEALKMFLEVIHDFDRDGVADYNGITVLLEGNQVEFVDYTDEDDPKSVTYHIQMVKEG